MCSHPSSPGRRRRHARAHLRAGQRESPHAQRFCSARAATCQADGRPGTVRGGTTVEDVRAYEHEPHGALVARRPRSRDVRVAVVCVCPHCLAPGAWRKRNEPALQSARGRSRCGAGTRPGMTGRAPVWRGVAARAAPLPAVGSLSPSPPVLVEGSAPMCGEEGGLCVGAGNNCVGCLRYVGCAKGSRWAMCWLVGIDPQMLEANGRCGKKVLWNRNKSRMNVKWIHEYGLSTFLNTAT
jgi:hypothetical protein